jgi:mannose-6-phosphate isomerase
VSPVTAQTTGEPQLSITAVPGISLMSNQIRDYDWGSPTALAQLQGRTPTGGPEAELWMGAHPAAPSDLQLDDGTLLPLPTLIERAAPSVLGSSVVARFGDRLPFLMKILAIAKPLSLQVHPDAARAELIYAPDGSSPYVDAFHKPEMLIALESVEVLYGFRPADRAADLISRLESERLVELTRALRAPGDDAERLHAALATLVAWPMSDRAALVAEVAAGSGRLRAAGPSDHLEAFDWVDRLVGLHPADPLVVAPLLFDLVRLAPGQSIFVPAGVPHSYLSGLGVEVLASSDNVLRAGLTSKTIAVEELLRVIDCRPVVSGGLSMMSLSQNEVAWRPPVAEFQMTRLLLRGDEIEASEAVAGPQIVVCTRGSVTVRANNRTLSLTPGQSVFVTAEAGTLTFGGTGEVFRAGPGLPA